jgi:hypothetical protein
MTSVGAGQEGLSGCCMGVYSHLSNFGPSASSLGMFETIVWAFTDAGQF